MHCQHHELTSAHVTALIRSYKTPVSVQYNMPHARKGGRQPTRAAPAPPPAEAGAAGAYPPHPQITPGNPMREAWVRKYPWGAKVLGARSVRRQRYLIDGTRVPGRALLGHKYGWRRTAARTRHRRERGTLHWERYTSRCLRSSLPVITRRARTRD